MLPEELRQQVEVSAYYIWKNEGCPHGRDLAHWLRAEAEILATPPIVEGREKLFPMPHKGMQDPEEQRRANVE